MLTSLRREKIVKLTNDNGSVNMQDLITIFNVSESTIRRDLVELDKERLITKVHGGAITINNVTSDYSVTERKSYNAEDKLKIAKYAASLIKNNDVVYIDAGTTTLCMIDFIEIKDAIYITNGIDHAKLLASKGYRVYLPGGILKQSTEALIGEEALLFIQKYHFTIGFFGTNAVSLTAGHSTPESQEANIKEMAMKHCNNSFILCDSSKLGKISSVTFAALDEGNIITTGSIPKEFMDVDNLIII